LYLLWDGSSGNLAKWNTDAGTGAAQVSVKSQDADGNTEAPLLDTNSILWVRLAEGEGWADVNPVEIPVAEGDLWDPGGTSAEVYEVEFEVVNNDAGAAAVTVSVGLDLASGGTLAAPEYWVFNEVVPYPGTTGWRGPFIMRGDDQIRGVASAANDASIHFRIKRVDSAS
jgi:hypothetical protein